MMMMMWMIVGCGNGDSGGDLAAAAPWMELSSTQQRPSAASTPRAGPRQCCSHCSRRAPEGLDSLGVDSLGSVGLLPFSSFPGLPFVWLRLCLRQWLLRLRRQSLWPWQKERGPFSHHLLQDEKIQPSACLRLLTGQAPQRGTPTMSKRRAQTTVWRTLQITTTTTCSRDMLKPKLKTFAYIMCNVIFCGGRTAMTDTM